MAEAKLVVELFALAIERSLTVLFVMVLVPLLELMPWILPKVNAVSFVVPLVILAMVLPEIVTVPDA